MVSTAKRGLSLLTYSVEEARTAEPFTLFISMDLLMVAKLHCVGGGR